MSAGGSAPKGTEPIQVDILAGTVAEVAETAVRVKNLAGLCRMGVIGRADDDEKAEAEDKPTAVGILSVTTEKLESALEDLARAEKDLLRLQEQMGEFAK